MKTAKKERYWVVMKLNKWDSVMIHGVAVRTSPDGPLGFLPVFKTKKQAVKFSGSDESVFQIESVS